MKKIGSMILLAVLCCLLTGCDATLRSTKFSVTRVTLDGPGSVGGDPRQYTITFDINRDGSSQNDTLDAFVSLQDRDGLPPFFEGSDLLAIRHVTIPANVNTVTTTLSLRCTSNGVGGDAGSSGEGRKVLFFFDDPADVFANVNERKSATKNVRCSN